MAETPEDPYRRVARRYDALFGRMNAGLRGLALRLQPAREGMEVLDVGCGTGIQLAAYQEAGCRVTGLDASPAMLEVARRRLGEGARLHLGDAARMPFPDGAFDLVLAATVFHEMDPVTRSATLGEIRRVARPDARLLVIDFEPGPVRPLRGWAARAVITVAETAAGRAHHRNYRDFRARGGVRRLVEEGGCAIEKERIVSGGAIGVYLVAAGGAAR